MADAPKRVAAAWLRARTAVTRDAAGPGGIFAPPQKAKSRDHGLGIFAPPAATEEPSTPPSPPREPTPPPEPPREPTPPPEPRQPSEPPRAPTPPPQPRPERGERAVPLTPGIQQMKRQQDFKQFLREKYEAGKALVEHPDPRLRAQRRNRDEPRIKFWTAMKYPSFKERVKREFEAWNQQMEAQRPRADVGSRIRDIAEMRRGDFVQWSLHGRKYKVLRFTDRGAVVLGEVDDNGRLKSDRVERLKPRDIPRARYRRIEELKRGDVSLDEAKKFANEYVGHPPREVDSREKYREWLDKDFRGQFKSPFYRLGDEDEPEHAKQLEKYIAEIMEERGVDDDWSWSPPPRAQIGHRVQDPAQVEVGDFVEHVRQKYRVKKIRDDGTLEIVALNNLGRPRPHGRKTLSPEYLRGSAGGYPVTRIEPVTRPKPSLEEVQKFVDEKLGFPPRDVDTQDKYRDWLDAKLRNQDQSPFVDLGDDETEHQELLKEQIDKILEARGVGDDWTWQKPPRPEIGERVHEPVQLEVGDFFRERGGRGFRVTEVDAGRGVLRAVRVGAHGRPTGRPQMFTQYDFRDRTYDRAPPITRPAVSRDDAARWASGYAADPGREVNDRDSYREWLVNRFKRWSNSPYYELGDDEQSHRRTLEQHVDSILEDRGIDEDWKWRGPPLVEFPADTDWERVHDEVRRAVLDGKLVRHPDAPEGLMDKRLGGGAADADIRRMEGPDGEQRDYVYKRVENEPSDYRFGTPLLHTREAAAYGFDRLLGEGTVVPPSVSDGTGSYQQLVEADNWRPKWAPPDVSAADLASHPDIQRMLFFDDLIGHEDRHYKNVMFSWKDPDGPRTADNLQIHAIDNGFALADFDAKNSPRHMVLQRDRILPFEPRVYERVLKKMPPELHEKVKALDLKDVLRSMVESGVKEKGALRSLAVRLRSLQDNPEILGTFIADARREPGYELEKHQSGRQKWHWMAGRHPEDLLSDHTSLDPRETMREIDREIRDALAAARGSQQTAR